MNWLLDHAVVVLGKQISYAELFGQLCALSVVFLAQRRTLWTWPVQVGAAVLLFSVYTSAHLGGLAIRQVIVLGISIYGWTAWVKRRDPVYGVAVRRATKIELGWLAVTLVVGTVVSAWLLQVFNASSSPWPDAAVFVGTAVAYLAQGLRFIEFWLIWLLVDTIGIPLQIASGLWFSAAVYGVFTALVIHGWFSWKRTSKSIETQQDSVEVAT